MKKALILMVKVARKAMEHDQANVKLGYPANPFFDLYGDALDAIYYLIGENTESLKESVTYRTVHNESLTDEQCAERLMAEAK